MKRLSQSTLRKSILLKSTLCALLVTSFWAFQLSERATACFMRAAQPVVVWMDHVQVDITDQVAVKTYHCVFKNPNGGAIVGGTCYMELEPGAQVSNMTVLVDGKKLEAEILSVKKANKIFKEIVKNGGSPALLEYYGSQLIQTKIPRIGAGKTVTVKLTYTMPLKKQGNLFRLQLLNTNPKAMMQPLKDASVTVNIKSKQPIKNVYSPTHEIDLVEKKGWDISVQWKQKNYLPKHPFVLYYEMSKNKIGASLIAHRERGTNDGHFMMMLSPTTGKGKHKITNDEILPKDVVFCIDSSGSMLKGNKMVQARKALKYCLKNLHQGDRFNIVDFSTTTRSFSPNGLVPFNKKSLEKALRYADDLHARGGTAIAEALKTSLDHLTVSDKISEDKSYDHLKMIVFATDGLPTIGEQSTKAILKHVAKNNSNTPQKVRLFTFGEGFDVNSKLLDFLALENQGESSYILPDEDIKKKIAQFFNRVGSPVMTDLTITIDGRTVETNEVFPRAIKDLFKEEQILLYGRYTGHGSATVKVTGQSKEGTKTLEFKVDFPKISETDNSSFIPRLWAGQKIDFLMTQIRQSKNAAPEKELVDEITYLAKRFGIVTPYTAYLVADDDSVIKGSGNTNRPSITLRSNKKSSIELHKAIKEKMTFEAAPAASPEDARGKQITDSKNEAEDRLASQRSGNSTQFYLQAEREMKRAGKTGSAMQAMRYIGSRAFFKAKNNQWFESLYDIEAKHAIQKVDVGSQEYFALLDQNPKLAKYLALGNVTLKIDKRWYQVQQQPLTMIDRK